MREEAAKTIIVDDEGSAKMLLRTLEDDNGTNLTLEFGPSFRRLPMQQCPNALRTRILRALEVNSHIEVLTLINIDDFFTIDQILASNKVISTLGIHIVDYGIKSGLPLSIEFMKSILQRGPKIDLHFAGYDDFDARSLSQVIPLNATLRSLTLSDCRLRERGVEYIYHAIQRSSAFSKLDISGSRSNVDSAFFIGSKLRSNVTLNELVLRHIQPDLPCKRTLDDVLLGLSNENRLNLWSPVVKMFGLLHRNETLTKFDDSFVCLKQLTNGLYELIRCDSTLNELTLRHVDFSMLGHSDTSGLVESLRWNTTIRILDLSSTFMSHHNVETLGRSLMDNQSLVHLLFTTKKIGAQPCLYLLKGLTANRTLKSLWFKDEYDMHYAEKCQLDVVAHAISTAVARNTGLEKITIIQREFSIESLTWLFTGLPQNKTLKELVLKVHKLGEAQASRIAQGLTWNKSLKYLEVYCHEHTKLACLADLLQHNTTLEELNIGSIYKHDQGLFVALAEALKVNTSMKRLWLTDELNPHELGTLALMEAYRDNPSMTCDILQYKPGKCKSWSWFYCQLNRTGRLWRDSTFPAVLWPRALALADIRSSADLLFHFIVEKPEIVKDCCRG